MDQIQLTIYFCMPHKIILTVVDWLKEQNKRNFCDMWKLHEIQIFVSINKVLMKHGHANSFVLMAVFALQ